MNSFKVKFSLNVNIYHIAPLGWHFAGSVTEQEFKDINQFAELLSIMRKTFLFKIENIQNDSKINN